MRNIVTIMKYELKRLFRDWRLVIIVLSQPMVIALIVGLVASHKPENIKVLVNETDRGTYSRMFVDELKKQHDLSVDTVDHFGNEEISNGHARAIVKLTFNQTVNFNGKVEIKTDPSGNLASIMAEQSIAAVASKVGKKMAEDNINSITKAREAYFHEQLPNIPSSILTFSINDQSYDPLRISVKEGTEAKIKYFDYYGSSMMVILVLLVILNLSGISITSERASGTFERMTVTPYRKVDIIVGKAAALYLIGLIVNILGIASLKIIYGINLGNLCLLALTTVLVVFMAVNLGLFVSAVTKNVVESVELAMYVFFVSFLLSGILLPIETSHKAYAWLMNSLPFSHAVTASRSINMLDAGWRDIHNDIGIIFAYAIIFLLLALVALRREAK